jgi:aminopeptidase-like protein
MNKMMEIIDYLTPLNRVFCSSDYDDAIEYLCTSLPFKVHEYPANQVHNGWVIPPKWDVKEAKIIKNGDVIYDGTKNPLSVISLSQPFRGTVDKDELEKHLYYDTRFNDAIPYHFRQMYRSWCRDWGFSVPKNFYDSLKDGQYDVIIDTEESDGVLRVLEYTKRGKLEDTIVIAAHLDHPGMSNDDIAGCAVGVELFKKLQTFETKFSYQLFIHQEVIGPEYYLAHLNEVDRGKLLEGTYIEMLGSSTKLGLQSAPQGMTNIEYFIKKELEESGIPFRHEPYGGVVVNGEYIYAGYGIPLSSLSRYPYPEYHTDKDNLSIMSEEKLDESFNLLFNAIERMEKDYIIRKKYSGTICAANPQYDLYIDPGQAAFGGFIDDHSVNNMRRFMELFPMYRRPVPIDRLSDIFNIEYSSLYRYIKIFEEKGLVDLI